MTLMVAHGPWEIAVSEDESAAVYVAKDWLEWSDRGPGGPQSGLVRAVIEVRRSAGGVLPRALVGGEIRLTGAEARVMKVAQSAEMTLGAGRTCPSRFREPLVPGLPPEFAQATLDGLVRAPVEWDAGVLLVVDRAAYDEVDSSPVAFELAGGLLALTLRARLDGADLDVSDLALMAF